MQIGLRHFGAETIGRVITASEEPGATRCGLARVLCEVSDWRDSQGGLALATARKLLPKLASKAGFRLPAAKPGVPETAAKAPAPEGLEAVSGPRCGLRDLGSVGLELVAEGDDRRSWDAMLAAWHPLGWKRAPGGQVRYWIRSSVHGVLGGIGFSAASWHQKARDEWIGWSADARAAHLGLVPCNHRFLLLPRIHGLASRVLGMATERIAGDWSEAYAARPVLACPYVSPEHSGECYRAAGWSCCPQPTSGQPPGSAQPGAGRAVWMKPFEAHRQIFEGDDAIDHAFMGQDPDAPDNRWLFEAYEDRVPVIYFLGIAPARYQAIIPTFISGRDPVALKASVSFGMPDRDVIGAAPDALERRYALRAVKQRLHQGSFREAVITAFRGRCALSRLREPRLLDAAHIVAGSDELMGQPVVTNGLPLSKIHHAAFDAHLIGVDPDYRIHVSRRLLDQRDGAMLKALKELDGCVLHLSVRREDLPDRDRSRVRFEHFGEAA